MFLGLVSGKSLLRYGLQTLLAGLVAIGINFLLEHP
jgi:VIT1/CCC1 family predicted Fe2+/Mn2+ transporter